MCLLGQIICPERTIVSCDCAVTLQAQKGLLCHVTALSYYRYRKDRESSQVGSPEISIRAAFRRLGCFGSKRLISSKNLEYPVTIIRFIAVEIDARAVFSLALC